MLLTIHFSAFVQLHAYTKCSSYPFRCVQSLIIALFLLFLSLRSSAKVTDHLLQSFHQVDIMHTQKCGKQSDAAPKSSWLNFKGIKKRQNDAKKGRKLDKKRQEEDAAQSPFEELEKTFPGILKAIQSRNPSQMARLINNTPRIVLKSASKRKGPYIPCADAFRMRWRAEPLNLNQIFHMIAKRAELGEQSC